MRRLVLALFAAAAAAGCAAPDKSPVAGRAELTGDVSYRERILLPPTTTLTVKLEDVSRADAAAEVLAEQTRVIGPNGPPYEYRLSFDRSRAQAGHSYAVRAELRDPDGRLRFTTTTRHAVDLTWPSPIVVDVQLEAAGS